MSQTKIVTAFLNPDFYNHPVDDIELVETHISWVFLTGNFAYKIKKPVDFGFLNFTTLEQRKFYCEQELLLNRRLAPKIYLEVVPVYQINNNLSLSEQGEIIDYAVKMKQFNQKYLFDQLLKNNQIELSHINNLSKVVASFHNKINIVEEGLKFGSPMEVIKPVEENFAILKKFLSGSPEQELLKSLHAQMLLMFESIKPQLRVRKQEGHIRECHGDLHLGNITIIENEIVLFDGIEFNDAFRWIDTISDCAFLIMDLQDHEQIIFANHFLNSYLSNTGDYSALAVLKFYLLYRATVRAKVAALRLQQQETASIAYKNTFNELKNYLVLAENYVQKKCTFLAISFGISGSGKSWVCSQLADQLGAIQLRSDVERQRVLSEKKYTDSARNQIYVHLMRCCELILDAGYSVIVDATFLDRQWRDKFREIAEQHQIPFHILSCFADQKTIKQRLKLRQNDNNNVSDADVSVMRNQLKNKDILAINEIEHEVLIDTAKPLNYQSIMRQIQCIESV